MEHATAPDKSGAVAASGTMIGAGAIIVTEATLLSLPSVPLQRGLLDMRRAARAQVIGGLQAAGPRQAIERVELLAGGVGDIEVERLRLVDPFLPPRRRLDQPGAVDLERGGVERLEIIGDAVDRADAAVEIFEVVDHHLVPQPARLEVAHQKLVHDGEVAGHVGFDIEVLVGGLDRLRDAADVGDRRRRRDRHHVGVAHAGRSDALAQACPSRASWSGPSRRRRALPPTVRSNRSAGCPGSTANRRTRDSARARRRDRPRPRSRSRRSPPCWCRRKPRPHRRRPRSASPAARPGIPSARDRPDGAAGWNAALPGWCRN